MGFLDRIENLVQGLVEGSASSVLRQKLTPVEIENRLEREMRDNTQPSRGGKLAPNSFTVWLHPDTFRETIAGVEGYNRHCELLLNQYASQQGYTMLHPRISVVFDTDADLGKRDVKVDADFDAPQQSPPMRAPAAAPPVSTQTQVIRPQPAAVREEASPWSLQVIQGNDLNQVLEIPYGESTVGRSSDCTIVLKDERNTVSRQHAVFINQGHELRIRDNGSKNGTRVNGNYIPYHVETSVTQGTKITFGECVVRVQMNRQQEGW